MEDAASGALPGCTYVRDAAEAGRGDKLGGPALTSSACLTRRKMASETGAFSP